MLGALLALNEWRRTKMTVKFNIVKPFRLTHRDGTIEDIAIGEHEFPDEYKDHFFIKHHSDQGGDDKPGLGTPEYATKMRALAEKRRAAAAEADDLAREAEEAHLDPKVRDARKAAREAGVIQATKPIEGGPNLEGAARAISPGLKGLPDRDAAVGNQIDTNDPIADNESSVLDADSVDGDDADDTNDDSNEGNDTIDSATEEENTTDPTLAAARREATTNPQAAQRPSLQRKTLTPPRK